MVKNNNTGFRVLGLMSGTSLDGLDLALSSFRNYKQGWKFQVEKAETVPYPENLQLKLSKAWKLDGKSLTELDHFYGRWLGGECLRFLDKLTYPDLIASHGHTVFHQPEEGFTLQIGNGNDIAAITKLPVIYDFRSLDVARGGQGAPLVPAGDELLFPNYDQCLNLGGFANISFKQEGKRIAFDICPVNIALNEISTRMNKPFDDMGKAGREGKTIPELLDTLNHIDFYKTGGPRSLGREWYEVNFRKHLGTSFHPADLLRTLYEHMADQIALVSNRMENQKILTTGGGAKNLFLIERLKSKSENTIIIPDATLIDYKEAIVFAFLGLLRYQNGINCFSSATGAESDSSAGVMVNPKV